MKRSEMSWLPNVLTGCNLFLGFWAVLEIIEGNYLLACWLIIAASICDAFDGKLARFMGSSSEMGIEMDSLADVVSFGLAPSVLLYVISLHKYGFAGVMMASLPLLFGTIRLARFNLTATTGEKSHYYQGLPIPLQANAQTTFILFNFAAWGDLHLEAVLIPLTFLLAFLMVSHIPYDSLPKLSIKEMLRHPWKGIVVLGVIVLVALNPPLVFFPLIMLIIFRGIVMAVFGLSTAEELTDDELDSELEIKH
jgi:CDP-diacylglycerol---serine O-phosphatidyltransferase